MGGDSGGLGAIPRAHLGKDGADMELYGALGDPQIVGKRRLRRDRGDEPLRGPVYGYLRRASDTSD